MKLKGRILALVIIPLVIVGVIAYGTTKNKTQEVIKGEILTGLKANVNLLRDAIEMDTEGGYTVNEQGHLLKGDFELTFCEGLIDSVYKKSGIVLTVCYGDERYITSVKKEDGSRAVGTKVSEEVKNAVIDNNGTYTSTKLNINGTNYYAYYEPIYNEGGSDGSKPVGIIFAGQPRTSVQDKVKDITDTLFLIIFIMLVVAIIAANIIVRRISIAIKKTTNVVTKISEGDLTVQIESKYGKRKDEIGDIARGIDKLYISLVDIITRIKNNSDELHNASAILSSMSEETSNTINQVETAVTEIAQGATSQAQETEKASDSVIKMGDMVEETSNKVNVLYDNASEMKKLGHEASLVLKELNKANQKSKVAIDEIYGQTINTNKSVQQIMEATTFITAIAEETNLLALNASIEAARAGEQGRGFAVVAAQIQKLAEQSNESATQIDNIVKTLISDSEKTVDTMEEVKTVIDLQNNNVERTSGIFKTVINGIEISIDGVNVIEQKTRELDEGRNSVVDAVQNLTAIAEENAASTEETSASIEEVSNVILELANSANKLETIAKSLATDVNIFKIN